MNAGIMVDGFNDEILSCVNTSDQYLDLPWTYEFDIWLNALFYTWLFKWCICEGNANPGCMLLKQSMSQRSSEHLCDLYDTLKLDNQKLLWALKHTLYNMIAQTCYLAFS
jgi:hypothetical protein